MTKPLPAHVRERLGKLLPLLSSDQPGEAANAAAAINRTLQNAGLDIHALNDVVTSEPAPVTAVVAREPPPVPAFHLYARPGGNYEIPEPQLSELLTQIRTQTFVTQWEDDFITSFEQRCRKYSGDLILVSEKQINILTRIIGIPA